MPNGKPAGVRCIQLDEQNLCKIFGRPERPPLCDRFKADELVCGVTNEQALTNLIELEDLTGP